jgi:hypothetical protein
VLLRALWMRAAALLLLVFSYHVETFNRNAIKPQVVLNV